MQPIRTRFVASAIAASSVHASKTSPLRTGPIGAKWSNTQQPSNPASSATRHCRRRTSTVVNC
jgi:hypothetical protein